MIRNRAYTAEKALVSFVMQCIDSSQCCAKYFYFSLKIKYQVFLQNSN